jgi:hypothetical protein
MERREHVRRRFALPVDVEGLGPGAAVSRDGSDGGLSFRCATRFAVGSALQLTIRVPPGGPVTVPLSARVVRISEPPGAAAARHYEVGVRFDRPVPRLAAFLALLPTSPTDDA